MDDDLTREEAADVAKQIFRRHRVRDCKGPLKNKGPLKYAIDDGEADLKALKNEWKGTILAELDQEEQVEAVRGAIRAFSLLPKGSAYARHRLKVLRKALELLERSVQRCGLRTTLTIKCSKKEKGGIKNNKNDKNGNTACRDHRTEEEQQELDSLFKDLNI
jgi:hypothetical protein